MDETNKQIIESSSKFAENISEIILGSIKPRQIKKQAQAKIDADMKLTASNTGLTEEEIMAIRRENSIALVKQNNLKNIVAKATPDFNTSNDDITSISSNWFMNFREKASFISDESVQTLWSRILSGEVNRPGSYSLQTLNILSMLDKNLVERIGNLFNYCCKINNKLGVFYLTPETNGQDYPIKIDEEFLIEIESLGIIKKYSAFGLSYFWFPKQEKCILEFGQKKIYITPKKISDTHYAISSGTIGITKLGKELYSLYQQEFRDDIINYIIGKMKQQEYEIEE